MIIADACHLLGRLIIFSKVGFYGQQKIKKVHTKEKKNSRSLYLCIPLPTKDNEGKKTSFPLYFLFVNVKQKISIPCLLKSTFLKPKESFSSFYYVKTERVVKIFCILF